MRNISRITKCNLCHPSLGVSACALRWSLSSIHTVISVHRSGLQGILYACSFVSEVLVIHYLPIVKFIWVGSNNDWSLWTTEILMLFCNLFMIENHLQTNIWGYFVIYLWLKVTCWQISHSKQTHTGVK